MNHIIGIYRSCPNIWLRNPAESHGNCASNNTRTRECLSPLVQFERLQGRSTPSNGNVHWHMMIMTLAFYGNFDGKILIIQLNQTWPSFKQTQPWSANSNGCVAQPLFQAPTAIPVRCHHLAMNQKSLARWILNSAGSMGLSSLQMWYHSIYLNISSFMYFYMLQPLQLPILGHRQVEWQNFGLCFQLCLKGWVLVPHCLGPRSSWISCASPCI